MMGYGYNGWWSMIWPIAFVIIAVVAIIAHSREQSPKERQDLRKNDVTDSALKILNELYAKGEVSDEEYQNRKKNLLN